MPASLINEYRVLSSFPESKKALEMLTSIGNIVRPIMLKRGWTLPLLAEFFPKQSNLLGVNVNRGKIIRLRLRPDGDRHSFLPIDDVVGTMLHELTHNLRGPHDGIFFKILDELVEEWFELRRVGRLPGQGFMEGGTRLGGKATASRNGLEEARLNALQRRLRIGGGGEGDANGGRVLGGSGVKVGTAANDVAQRRRAAEAAAESRRRAALISTCPDSQEVEAQVEKEQREAEKQGIEVIVIEDDSSTEEEGGEEEDGGGLEITGVRGNGTAREVGEDSVEIVYPPHNGAASRSERRKQARRTEAAALTAAGQKRKAGTPLPGRQEPSLEDEVEIVSERIVKRPSPRAGTSAAAAGGSSSTMPSTQAQVQRGRQRLNAASALRQELLSGSATMGGGGASLSNGVMGGGSSSSSTIAGSRPSVGRKWTCQTCTLLNSVAADTCDACTSPRPGLGSISASTAPSTSASAAPDFATAGRHSPTTRSSTMTPSWACRSCGHVMRAEAAVFWSCALCGRVRGQGQGE